MSIASEITRLQSAKTALKTAINAKTDAQHQINDETIDEYADFVDSIEASDSKSSEIINKTVTSLSASDFGDTTEVGEYAFSDCGELETVSLPSSITKIGAYAFCGCTSLTTIDLSNVTEIGEHAFDGCSNLATVKIPARMISIGECAFLGCSENLHIELPSNTTTIDIAAFKDCVGLIKITIPSTVTEICEGAFSGCVSLSDVTIESSSIVNEDLEDTFIFDYASRVTIPKTVAPSGITNQQLLDTDVYSQDSSGDYYIFYSLLFEQENNSYTVVGSTKAETRAVFVPQTFDGDSVVEISGGVFSGHNKIEEITLPFLGYSLTDTGSNITPNTRFGYIFGEEEYSGSESTDQYDVSYFIPTSLKRVILKSGTILPYYSFRNCSNLKYITLPTTMTKLNSNCFYHCTNLISVNIPSGVTSIDSNAFSGCESLKRIDLPDGLTSLGMGSFQNCRSIITIRIPPLLQSLTTQMFFECFNLKSVVFAENCTIKTLGMQAFWGCRSLSYINIPKTVTSINASSFGMSGLKNITVDNENTTYDSRDNCNAVIKTSTNHIVVGTANMSIPETVTGIDAQAISRNPYIKNITIPANITSIASNAITGENISSIVVDSNNTVYDSRNNCNAIIETATNTLISGCSNTVIPNSVVAISNNAFAYSGISHLEIPDGVETIGSFAFGQCQYLISIFISSSVSSINDNAFNTCPNVKQIIVDSNNTIYDSRNNCNAIIETSTDTLLRGCKNTDIPSDILVIGKNSFMGVRDLDSVTIPANVTSIGVQAFYQCYELSSVDFEDNSQLTTIGNSAFSYCAFNKITLPPSVTTLGSSFASCENLNTFEFSNTIISFANNTFSSSPNLSKINYLGTLAQWCSLNFSQVNANPLSVARDLYINGTKVETISESDLSGATTINQYAFAKSTIKSIAIPDTVLTIGTAPFYMCDYLESITVNSNNAIYDSRNDCNAVIETATNKLVVGYKNSTIPNTVTSIGTYAFYYCRNITNITITDGIESIGNYAFYGCSALSSVTFSANSQLTSIGDYAFYGCKVLPQITIPASVKTIGASAFDSCDGILNFVFESGSQLQTIGQNGIRKTSITTISIPSTITSIGSYAFYNCTALSTIYIYATTPPTLGNTSAIPSNVVTIYIPAGSLSAYSTKTNWRASASKFVEMEE